MLTSSSRFLKIGTSEFMFGSQCRAWTHPHGLDWYLFSYYYKTKNPNYYSFFFGKGTLITILVTHSSHKSERYDQSTHKYDQDTKKVKEMRNWEWGKDMTKVLIASSSINLGIGRDRTVHKFKVGTNPPWSRLLLTLSSSNKSAQTQTRCTKSLTKCEKAGSTFASLPKMCT